MHLFDNPGEFLAHVQQQAESAHGEMQAFQNDLRRLLGEELTVEQLITLRRVIAYVGASEGRTAMYYEGVITAIIEHKHGLCGGCGKDHLLDTLTRVEPHPDEDEPTTVETLGGEKITFTSSVSPQPDTRREYPPDSEREENMEKYGLREADAMDFERGLIAGPDERPVFCKECGALYQSLEDRMLRPPLVDGCQGCQHKAAHG